MQLGFPAWSGRAFPGVRLRTSMSRGPSSRRTAHRLTARLLQLPVDLVDGGVRLDAEARAPWGPSGHFGFESHGGKALRDVDGAGAHLDLCDFSDTTWEAISLPEATITLCSFVGAKVTGLQAPRSHWVGVDLRDSRLHDCDLTGARLLACDLQGADLSGVRLRGADLRGCDLRGAILLDVDLEGADLRGADLRRVGGLDSAARSRALAAGARVGGWSLWLLWARLLSGDPIDRFRRGRRLAQWTWIALAWLLPALFFGRAALHPVDPDVPPPPIFGG